MKDVDSTQEGGSFHDEKGAILGSIGAINGWNICPELHPSSLYRGGRATSATTKLPVVQSPSVHIDDGKAVS